MKSLKQNELIYNRVISENTRRDILRNEYVTLHTVAFGHVCELSGFSPDPPQFVFLKNQDQRPPSVRD